MKNKILVLGRGFLGKAFEKKGFEVWGKDRFELSLFHRGKNWKELNKLDNYDIIINCIGKSNTRWCEERENLEKTEFSNKKVPKILSNYCKNKNKKFVHISTGCLYDRNDVPQKETDFTAAHCKYTLTKWLGEEYCNPEKDLILRPRLYFGDFEDKNNLLCKMKNFDKFLIEKNSYTSVHIIVEATSALLGANQSGIFNVACDGFASVKEIANWIGLPLREEITAEELHKKENLYLVNNTMDILKLQNFYKPPRLEDEIMRCWRELK